MLWHALQNGIAVLISFASESMLEMSGGAEASAAMITEQPAVMLVSAGMMLAFFGAGTAVLLALLLFVTHGQHKAHVQPENVAGKTEIWAYAPLLAALAAILYMYITGTMALMGGGV